MSDDAMYIGGLLSSIEESLQDRPDNVYRSKSHLKLLKLWTNSLVEHGEELSSTDADRVLKIYLQIKTDMKCVPYMLEIISTLINIDKVKPFVPEVRFDQSALGILELLKMIVLESTSVTHIRTLAFHVLTSHPINALSKLIQNHCSKVIELIKLYLTSKQQTLEAKVESIVLLKLLEVLPPTEKSLFVKQGIGLWLSSVLTIIMEYLIKSKSCDMHEEYVNYLEMLTTQILHENYFGYPEFHTFLVKICDANGFPLLIKTLFESGKHVWYRIWILFLKLLQQYNTRCIEPHGTPINSLLPIVETAFKNEPMQRVRAFACWTEVINNFSLEQNENCMPKRVKLLLTPLKLNNAKTEETIVAKFDTWWHLIRIFQPKMQQFLNEILMTFIQFAFGTSNLSFRACQVTSLKKKCLEAFVEIVGHCDSDDNGCSTDIPSLKEEIMTSFLLVDHWNDWYKALNCAIKVAASLKCTSAKANIQCVWKSIMTMLAGLSDNTVRRDIFSELVKLLTGLVEDCKTDLNLMEILVDSLMLPLFSENIKGLLVTKSEKRRPMHTIVTLIMDVTLNQYYNRLSHEELMKRLKPVATLLMEESVKNQINIVIFSQDLPQNDCTLKLWMALVETLTADKDKPIQKLSHLLMWPLKSMDTYNDVKQPASTWYTVFNIESVNLMNIGFNTDLTKLLAKPINGKAANYFALCALVGVLKHKFDEDLVKKFKELKLEMEDSFLTECPSEIKNELQNVIASIEKANDLEKKSDNVMSDCVSKVSASPKKEVKKTKKRVPSIVNRVVENGEEYEVVKSNWKFNPKNMTVNQKERLQRKRENPALYQDLSQSQDEFQLSAWKTDSQDTSLSSSKSSKSATNNNPSEILKNMSSTDVVPLIMENIFTECNKTPQLAQKVAKSPKSIEKVRKVDNLPTASGRKSPRLALKDRIFKNVRNLIEKSSPLSPQNCNKNSQKDPNQIESIVTIPLSKPFHANASNQLKSVLQEDLTTVNLATSIKKAETDFKIVNSAKQENLSVMNTSITKEIKSIDNTDTGTPTANRPARMKRKPKKYDDTHLFGLKRRRYSHNDAEDDTDDIRKDEAVPVAEIQHQENMNSNSISNENQVQKNTIAEDVVSTQQKILQKPETVYIPDNVIAKIGVCEDFKIESTAIVETVENAIHKMKTVNTSNILNNNTLETVSTTKSNKETPALENNIAKSKGDSDNIILNTPNVYIPANTTLETVTTPLSKTKICNEQKLRTEKNIDQETNAVNLPKINILSTLKTVTTPLIKTKQICINKKHVTQSRVTKNKVDQGTNAVKTRTNKSKNGKKEKTTTENIIEKNENTQENNAEYTSETVTLSKNKKVIQEKYTNENNVAKSKDDIHTEAVTPNINIVNTLETTTTPLRKTKKTYTKKSSSEKKCAKNKDNQDKEELNTKNLSNNILETVSASSSKSKKGNLEKPTIEKNDVKSKDQGMKVVSTLNKLENLSNITLETVLAPSSKSNKGNLEIPTMESHVKNKVNQETNNTNMTPNVNFCNTTLGTVTTPSKKTKTGNKGKPSPENQLEKNNDNEGKKAIETNVAIDKEYQNKKSLNESTDISEIIRTPLTKTKKDKRAKSSGKDNVMEKENNKNDQCKKPVVLLNKINIESSNKFKDGTQQISEERIDNNIHIEARVMFRPKSASPVKESDKSFALTPSNKIEEVAVFNSSGVNEELLSDSKETPKNEVKDVVKSRISRIEKQLMINMAFLNVLSDKRLTRAGNQNKTSPTSNSSEESQDRRSSSPIDTNTEEPCSEDIIESSQDSTLTTISTKSTKRTPKLRPVVVLEKVELDSNCTQNVLQDSFVINISDSDNEQTRMDIDLPENKTAEVDNNNTNQLTENMDTEPMSGNTVSDDVVIMDDSIPSPITIHTNSVIGPDTQELAEADTQPNPAGFMEVGVEVCALVENHNSNKPNLQTNTTENDITQAVPDGGLSLTNVDNTNEESSPFKGDDRRKQDFLNDTLEISPIKILSPDKEKKSPSPETSDDFVVIKLSSPVQSNGEPFEKSGSPEFFTEDKVSPERREASPLRAETRAGSTSPSSSLSLKRNRPQVRSGGRAAHMLGLLNASENRKVFVIEHTKPDETKKANTSTPAKRNLRILYNSIGAAADASTETNHGEDAENFLQLQRTLPTVTSSPSGPILKRKLADITDETSVSPASKRKRVSFLDPPVSTTISVHKYLQPILDNRSPQSSPRKRPLRSRTKSPKNLDNAFKSHNLDSVLSTTVESFNNTEQTATDDTQTTSLDVTPAVEIVKTSELNDTDPIFPNLIDCKDPIHVISADLSSTAMKELFVQELEGKVETVGDLAKMTELEVNRLCIKAPKIKVTKKVLEEYCVNKEAAELVETAVVTTADEVVPNDRETQTVVDPVTVALAQTEKIATADVETLTDEVVLINMEIDKIPTADVDTLTDEVVMVNMEIDKIPTADVESLTDEVVLINTEIDNIPTTDVETLTDEVVLTNTEIDKVATADVETLTDEVVLINAEMQTVVEPVCIASTQTDTVHTAKSNTQTDESGSKSTADIIYSCLSERGDFVEELSKKLDDAAKRKVADKLSTVSLMSLLMAKCNDSTLTVLLNSLGNHSDASTSDSNSEDGDLNGLVTLNLLTSYLLHKAYKDRNTS